MAAATSRRKQADSSEAATAPMAVASRVFERPGCGALQMIPIAATAHGRSRDRRRSAAIAINCSAS